MTEATTTLRFWDGIAILLYAGSMVWLALWSSKRIKAEGTEEDHQSTNLESNSQEASLAGLRAAWKRNSGRVAEGVEAEKMFTVR